MSKIPTVEELRRDRQPITMAQFLTISTHYGFEISNGSNHIRATHTKYPDITFAPSNHKRRANLIPLRLADAIERVQERENALERKTKQQFQLAADEHAATRLNDLKDQLPNHIEAFYNDANQIILRHTNVPQIGLTLYCEQEDAQLSVKIERLAALEHEFHADIGRAHTQYDIQVSKNGDGTYTLSHKIYDHMASVTLHPYPEAEEPLTALITYIDKVETIDGNHKSRLEIIKEQATNFSITAPQQRGERHNVVVLRPDIAIPFTTASHQKYIGDGSRARISEGELKVLEQTVTNVLQTGDLVLARA